MVINRDVVKNAFMNYVENYDSTDEKIRLKIEHTFRVSELCERIAISLQLNEEDIELAWLTGVLHDIGRFEQVRRHGTFNDLLAEDHASLGCEILFDNNKIRDFIYDDYEDELIRCVVENHNKYRLQEDISERNKAFANILRDADKIDILRVNVMSPLEEIYNVTKDEIDTSEVTKEVMDNFIRKDTILRSLKKTAIDNVVGHISLVFGLRYKESIRIVKEQGYLDKLLQFESKNEVTTKQFDKIRDVVNKYRWLE